MKRSRDGLRVLVVNWQDRQNPHAGGAEIHLHEIFGRLAAWGHSVTLLCSGWPDAPARAEIGGIEVVRVGSRYTFPFHARRAFKRLAPAGYDVLVEDINKLPLYTPRWSRIPVVALVPHLFGSTAFRQEPPTVATTVWLAERLMPRVYRDVPVEVISDSTRDDLVNRGFDRHRITVSYPGVDHELCTPGDGGPGAHRSSEPLLVYVGRIQRYKSIDTVIRALPGLEVDGRPVRLVVAGRGEDHERLERIATSLGVAAQVEFQGYVSEEEKVSLFRRAWANVYPSPKEGWGITNIEAAACGTPSLAADSPGLRESVVDGETGRLIPFGDVSAWHEVIAGYIADVRKREAMGMAAVRHAAQFTWNETARQTEAVLRSVA